jgi:hypothetical protein
MSLSGTFVGFVGSTFRGIYDFFGVMQGNIRYRPYLQNFPVFRTQGYAKA